MKIGRNGRWPGSAGFSRAGGGARGATGETEARVRAAAGGVAGTLESLETRLMMAASAVNDFYTLPQNGLFVADGVGLNPPGVLANDSGAATAILAGPPSHGAVSLNGDGSFSYTPSPNFIGVDAFTYYATSVAAPATFIPLGASWKWLHPQNGQDPNAADPDSNFHTTWFKNDGGYNGPAFNGPSPAPLGYGGINYAPTLTDIGQPPSGQRYTAYFTHTFELAAAPSAVQSLTARILADDGAYIYINGQLAARHNVSATAADSYTRLALGTSIGGADTEGGLFNLTLNPAMLVQGQNFIAVSLHNATNASSDLGFDIELAGMVFSDPPSGVATVQLQVMDAAVPPRTVADAYTLYEDRTLDTAAMSLPSTLANDGLRDAMGIDYDAILSVTVNAAGTRGAVAFDSLTGHFTFTPEPDFNGSTSFTYIVTDKDGPSLPTTVSLNVLAVDDAPVIGPDAIAQATEGGEGVTLDPLANDQSPDGLPGSSLGVSVLDAPPGGTVAVNADGRTFTFTPSPNFSGLYSFGYLARNPATLLIERGGTLANPVGSQAWRYMAGAVSIAPDWMTGGFDDAAWPAAVGELGYVEADQRTTVPFVDVDPVAPGVQKNAATFFRTEFEVWNLSQIAELSMRLRRDDAAAVYLNGVEIFRDATLPANAGPGDYTLGGAAGTPDGGSLDQLIAIDPALLLAGRNVLAVSVHQASAADDDLSFDLELAAVYATPAAGMIQVSPFLPQRAPIAVADHFEMDEDGTLTGNVIDNEYGPGLSVILVGLAPGHGTFNLNSNGVFTYTPDPDFNSDLLTPDVFDPAHDIHFSYKLVRRFDDLVLSSAPTAVTIRIKPKPDAPIGGGDHYQVAPGGTLATNLVPASSATLIQRGGVNSAPQGDHIWRYLDNGTNPGPNWTAFGFDDELWKLGAGELGYGDGDERTVTQYVDVDPVAPGDQRNATTFFRSTFNVADPAAIQLLLGSVKFDDGVAVYINGQEVYRKNLDPGAAYNQYATTTVANENAFNDFTIRTWQGLLAAGANVIAVEVHQASATSGDISLDLELKSALIGQDTTVIANDRSPDGRRLAVSLLSAPLHHEDSGGASPFTLSAEGAFTYRPVAGYQGPDSFTYQLTDGLFTSAPITVTISVQPADVPFSRIEPAGGLAMSSSVVNASLASAADQKDHYIQAQAGQSISVVIDPAAALRPIVELYSPEGALIGTFTAPQAGQDARLSAVAAPSTGLYRVRVRASSGLGAYAFWAHLNAAVEAERHNGPLNGSAAVAQNLSSAFRSPIASLPTFSQAAVIGALGTLDEDWYAVDLSDGQALSLALRPQSAGSIVLSLFDASLNALGSGLLQGADWWINGFVDRTTNLAPDIYYVRVSGSNIPYTLSAFRDGHLQAAGASSSAPLDMSLAGRASAYLVAPGATSGLAGGVAQTWFSFYAAPGDAISISTFTPFDGLVPPRNTLAPGLSLLGPDGTPVAIQEAAAPDGRNLTATFTAEAGGLYRLAVFARSGAGEVVVDVAGESGQAPAPVIIALSPAHQSTIAAPPGSITLTFSRGMKLHTLQPGDLLIDGLPAAQLSHLDGRTIQFTLPAGLAWTEGLHTLSVAAGAANDLAGRPVDAFEATFTLDTLGPRITGVEFNGQPPIATLVSGSLAFAATFSEPLFAGEGQGPWVPVVADVSLYESISGRFIAPVSLVYDPQTLKLSAVFSQLPEGNYQLKLLSSAGRIIDRVGNRLDGEPLGAGPGGAPSGNGVAGGDYSVSFTLDNVSTAAGAFVGLEPLGSLIYASRSNSGVLHDAADVDEWTFDLLGLETFAIELIPVDPMAIMTLEVSGLTGVMASPSPGKPVALGATPAQVTGARTLRVAADRPTAYTLKIYRNADLESSILDPVGLTPLNLAASRLPIGGGRYAAIGVSDTSNFSFEIDDYLIDLTDSIGKPIDFILKGLDGADFSTQTLQLFLPNAGSLAALGSREPLGVDPEGVDLAIYGYVPAIPGHYRLRLFSTVVGNYSVVVGRSLLLASDPGSQPTDPLRLLDQSEGALGYLAAPDPIFEGFETGDLSLYSVLGGQATASISPLAAHDGSLGLLDSSDLAPQPGQDEGWLIRNDVAAQVKPGDRLSVWVKLGPAQDQRAYFAFGAGASGALSAVLAPNTGQLILQNNTDFGYANLAVVPMNYQHDHWYRLQIDWGTDGVITAGLYDSDGQSRVTALSAFSNASVSGGFGFRAFGSDTAFDSVQRFTGAATPDPLLLTALQGGAPLAEDPALNHPRPRVGVDHDHDNAAGGGAGGFYLPPTRTLGVSALTGQWLSAPAASDPLQIARGFILNHAGDLGLEPGDLRDFRITGRHVSQVSGASHFYFRQYYSGLPILNADLNITVAADGRVLSVGSSFLSGLYSQPEALTSGDGLTASQALESLAGIFGWTLDGAAADPSAFPSSMEAFSFDPYQPAALSENPIFSLPPSGVSLEPIPVDMHYVPTADGLVRLAWNLTVQTPDGAHWYDASIDAANGRLLHNVDWSHAATYNVYPAPAAGPDESPRQLLIDPFDPLASPFGWHDTDGIAGPEYTDTRGNNVFAQEDRDANNVGGFRPSGGASLNFNFPIDLSQHPSTYEAAAITNLFYLSNHLHDVYHHYGFDEAAGNFQQTNYGSQGLGGDPVRADAQDGSGFNNANFSTPPDGQAPRMQMYLFNSTNPMRDGSLDAQIVIHEYSHGLTNRLTGGPANSGALFATQSGAMGEGWSDWFALMLTQQPSDGKLQAYPIAAYAVGDAVNGKGIRRAPYSFDMTINPITFGQFNLSSQAHNAGEIWASALWDLNWLLIDQYGFSADIKQGDGGNNLAMKLVIEGLKLQPANPTFLQGRDAILQADQLLTGGANQSTIWTAFARRGMGYSATAGASASSTSVVQAFDLPATPLGAVSLDASYYEAGQLATVTLRDSNLAGLPSYSLAIISSGGDVESITLAAQGLGIFRGTIPIASTAVVGDGKIGGATGQTFTVIYNDQDNGMGHGAVTTDSAELLVFAEIFHADFADEQGAPGADGFTLLGSHSQWHLSTGRASQAGHSGPYSFYFGAGEGPSGGGSYADSAGGSITSPPIDLAGLRAPISLKFNHFLSVEPCCDSAQVWILDDTGQSLLISSGQFTGLGYQTTGFTPVALDLSAWQGREIRIRFTFSSDATVSPEGWYVDDVVVRGATANPTLVGPILTTIDPPPGIINNLQIDRFTLTFSEPIDPVSALNPANYRLVAAGPNGLIENGLGDDESLPLSIYYDGQTTVELVIQPGFAPLHLGSYQLLLSGADTGLIDLEGNPLNSTSGPGGGSNRIRRFDVVLPVEEGGNLYKVNLLAGQLATIITGTPLDGATTGQSLNTLDPRLVILAPNGTIAATDDNSLDGRNARAQFVVPTTGTYLVHVLPVSGAGPYTVSFQTQEIDIQPPQMVDLLVSSSHWSPQFMAAVDPGRSLGWSVFAPGAPPIPWAQIDQVTAIFSEAVAITEADLSITGLNVDLYPLALAGGFSFDPQTRRATWTLGRPLATDQVQFHFNPAIQDGAGLTLDGRAEYLLSVSPGDVNFSGQTDGTDIGLMSQRYRNPGAYDPVWDLNRDGAITIADYNTLVTDRRYLGTFFGDANLSGSVAIGDLTLLAENFSMPGGWDQGDFNGDGQVGIGDLTLLAENFSLVAGAQIIGLIQQASGPALILNDPPNLNDQGEVALRRRTSGGSISLELAQAGATQPLAQEGAGFDLFISPASFNNSGQALFAATIPGGQALFRASAGGLVALADSSGPIDQFLGLPELNDSGQAVYLALMDDGSRQIHLLDGGLVTLLAAGANWSQMDEQPRINYAGQVAARLRRPDGSSILALISEGQVTPLVEAAGLLADPMTTGRLALNDAGRIAFRGQAVGGRAGIFTVAPGTAVQSIAELTDGFTQFLGSPAINLRGDAAFAAVSLAGLGIYRGPNPSRDKVVMLGDALAGSIVVNLNLDHLAINELGQIAFHAELADGRSGYWLSTPNGGSEVGNLLLEQSLTGDEGQALPASSAPAPAALFGLQALEGFKAGGFDDPLAGLPADQDEWDSDSLPDPGLGSVDILQEMAG